MKGSIIHQVQVVFKFVDCRGQSKHQAKAAARESGASTYHDIGKKLGIYSHGTADAYRDVWVAALNYVKDATGCTNREIMDRMTGEHIKAFLDAKIADGVKHATFNQYSAALEKLETALNRYVAASGMDSKYHFTESISESRITARTECERFEGSRAYESPRALVDAVQDERHSIAAAAMYESGGRVSEVDHIMEDQLKGPRDDKVTGDEKYSISVQGKGGFERDLFVSRETYERIKTEIDEHGFFEFDKDSYRGSLKGSAEATGQEYHGSHGLRWNWAQERFQECQEHGMMTYEEALSLVSEEMGHHRSDITEHYLR